MNLPALLACVFCTLAATQMATLLLPGFEGHQLEARLLEEKDEVTTFMVTCPATVLPSSCGIPHNAITAIVASGSAELIHVKRPYNTAFLSCSISGTTYASCHARQTVSVHGTLAAKDVNWMEIPIITTGAGPVSLPTSLVTSIGVESVTDMASVPTKASTITKATGDSEIVSSAIALTLYNNGLFGLVGSLGAALIANLGDWRMPPFPFRQ